MPATLAELFYTFSKVAGHGHGGIITEPRNGNRLTWVYGLP